MNTKQLEEALRRAQEEIKDGDVMEVRPGVMMTVRAFDDAARTLPHDVMEAMFDKMEAVAKVHFKVRDGVELTAEEKELLEVGHVTVQRRRVDAGVGDDLMDMVD